MDNEFKLGDIVRAIPLIDTYHVGRTQQYALAWHYKEPLFRVIGMRLEGDGLMLELIYHPSNWYFGERYAEHFEVVEDVENE